MLKHWFKLSLLLLVVGVATFFACTKNDATQTAEEYLDETLYSIQERGGMGKYGCYELVFPVTINFPDSTSLTVNSYDEMKTAIRDWFEANPGNPGGPGHHGHHGQGGNIERPTLAFPLTVISPDGELITVNNDQELKELKKECGGGTFGHHGHHGHGQHGLACFEIQFPITVVFPDGTTAAAADQKALHQMLRDWKKANPGSTDRPEIQFPITVVMKDDGTVVTVNSKDELKDLKENCD